MWKEFQVTNSFTLEASFFGYMRGDTLTRFTDNDYYQIGESLMQSIFEYTHLLKQLEYDLVVTRGWLKPSKFIQITGTPAADVFKRTLSLQREEEKKRIRREKVNQYIIKIKSKAHKSNSSKKHLRNEANVNGNNNKFLVHTSSNLKRMAESCKKSESALPAINKAKILERSTFDSASPDIPRIIESDNPYAECADWKKYFTSEEINLAYNQISSGIDPNDFEDNSENSSESYASESEKEIIEDKLSPITALQKLKSIAPKSCLSLNSKESPFLTNQKKVESDISDIEEFKEEESMYKEEGRFKRVESNYEYNIPSITHLSPEANKCKSKTPICVVPGKTQDQAQNMCFTKYDFGNKKPENNDPKSRKRFEPINEKAKPRLVTYPKHFVEIYYQQQTNAMQSPYKSTSKLESLYQKRVTSNNTPSHVDEPLVAEGGYSPLFKCCQSQANSRKCYNVDIKERKAKMQTLMKPTNSLLICLTKPTEIKININACNPVNVNWSKSSPRWTSRIAFKNRRSIKSKKEINKSINASGDKNKFILSKV